MSCEKPDRRWASFLPSLIVLSVVLPLARGASSASRPVGAFQDPVHQPAYVITALLISISVNKCGWSKPPRRITITNTGGQPLSVDSVATGGDQPGDFTIVKDTCTGATVAPNRACIVDVSFVARRPEDRRANVQVTGSAINCPQTIRLKGTGINSNDVPPF